VKVKAGTKPQPEHGFHSESQCHATTSHDSHGARSTRRDRTPQRQLRWTRELSSRDRTLLTESRPVADIARSFLRAPRTKHYSHHSDTAGPVRDMPPTAWHSLKRHLPDCWYPCETVGVILATLGSAAEQLFFGIAFPVASDEPSIWQCRTQSLLPPIPE